LRWLLPLAVLIAPTLARAADPATGNWRATEGPDNASGLELGSDGHFRWFLSAGALDEEADGHWTRDGALIRLFTEPKPRAPTLTLATASPEGKDDAALFLFVAGPNGAADDNGIAGVDFHIEFDHGDPVEGYTQYYGWSLGSTDGRVPLWVRLVEPINGIESARIAIPPGTKSLRFLLQPNDMGVVDFDGAEVHVERDRLTLAHRMGLLHYARVAE
jgi:hypothetical protein